MRRHLLIALAGATLAAPSGFGSTAAAQDPAALFAAAAPDATIRVHFAARPGVCGSGDVIWLVDGSGRRSMMRSGNSYTRASEPAQCETGPVRIELRRSGGRITGAQVRVGAPEPSAQSVEVAPAAAARLLLAESTLHSADARAANDLVFGATLADTETWPQLLQLARARDLRSDTRRTAIFWLGQAAGDRAVAGLTSVIGDDSDEIAVRESAVFALSRMQGDASIDALIHIARTHSEPKIRRSAMFWLAQSGTPRAIAFFEEVLRAGG